MIFWKLRHGNICNNITLYLPLAQVCAAAYTKTQIRRQEWGFSIYLHFCFFEKTANST
jgi:hypothetical protein